jgi:hypothetical protein
LRSWPQISILNSICAHLRHLRQDRSCSAISAASAFQDPHGADDRLHHQPGEFWNFAHAARIRAFLELSFGKATWFLRRAEKGGVTKEVIFGTPNRVSQGCSNNPIMQLAGLA